jgi:hypothetical protein
MIRFLTSRRPSPALVVSIVALVAALGGTSYAAFTLPTNSVSARQLTKGAVTSSKLKTGAVTSGKLKTGAVTTSKIRNGSVTKAKLKLTGLVVPNATHSTTADTAHFATQATNATHASTAGSASAVAYAHVLANGTLDTAHSRNVSAASNPSTGVYCLKIDVPVVNASATVDFGGKFGIADAVLRGEDPANEVGTFCSAADNALVGTAGADTGTVDNRAFWVTFN